MATGAFSEGANPPEVTLPAAVPFAATMWVPARAGARPSGRMPTRSRVAAMAQLVAHDDAAGESPVRRAGACR